MRKRSLVVLSVLVAVLGTAPPAGAAAPADPKPSHCVVHVVGQKASGELVVTEPRCYPTFDLAMRAEGVAYWGEGAAARAQASAAAAAGVGLLSFALGTHYDLPNLNPANGSTSTVGTGCTGGWLNTSAAWDNRISSTANGCPTIDHFDGANLVGTKWTTTGLGGNAGAMDNRTSSIKYS